MLTSLFGDLGSRASRRLRDDDTQGFAATAILEHTDTELNARGQIIDRHSSDLVVSGSPAQAIRDHFAASRPYPEGLARQFTLFDPASAWASAVIKALSDAAGGPIERLHLREQTTLRTLATIERTTLTRRNEETLKIYYADVRAPGPDNEAIALALMERSHLAVVIVGPMPTHAIDAMLVALHDATRRATWRCPELLFLLPPSAVWIADKIGALAWPKGVRVQAQNEPLISASAVWNAILATWQQVRDPAAREAATVLTGGTDFPIKVADLVNSAAVAAAPSPRQPVRGLDARRAAQSLAVMGSVEGLLGCAVVEAASGMIVARHVRHDPPVDMELAAAASAQALRTHRLAARNMGLAEPVDEIITSAATRVQVMRSVTGHPDLFVFALLDRQRANLAMARYRLMQAETGME